MTPHTCIHCQRIVLKPPDPLRQPSAQESDATSAAWTVDELMLAANDRCMLFLALLRNLRTAGHTLEDLLPTPRVWQFWEGSESSRFVSLNLSLGGSDDAGPFGMYQQYWLKRSKEIAELESPSTDEVCDALGRHRMNAHPDSDFTYRLARTWIQNCITHHCHLTIQDDWYRPLRLLHIRKQAAEYNVHLEEPASRSLHYTALSYCWGGVQSHRTTKARLRDGLISYENLPKTLQDAIRVTAELGYSYIWIDSLCIVQDDEVEMQREIAKMPYIYNRAVVTIAAASARSATDGFLHERIIDDLIISNIPIQNPDSSMHTVRLIQDDTTDETSMALEERAWALQEFVLSTRILRFGHRQLQFICSRSYASDQRPYTDGWSPSDDRLSLILVQLGQFFFDGIDPVQYWHDLVRAYSQRKLSVPTDRILAISGIARRLGGHIDVTDGYVAGHWLSMLPRDLLWYSVNGPQPRRTQYLGPSWSWTGTDCWVGFEYESKFGTSSEAVSHRVTWNVLGVDVQLVNDQAPFGAVREATLRLKAPVKPASLFRLKMGAGDRHTWFVRTQDDPDENHSVEVMLDTDIEIGDAALCVRVVVGLRGLYESRARGIIVQEVQRDGQPGKRYQRCGVFHCHDAGYLLSEAGESTWLDAFEEDVIEIV